MNYAYLQAGEFSDEIYQKEFKTELIEQVVNQNDLNQNENISDLSELHNSEDDIISTFSERYVYQFDDDDIFSIIGNDSDQFDSLIKECEIKENFSDKDNHSPKIIKDNVEVDEITRSQDTDDYLINDNLEVSKIITNQDKIHNLINNDLIIKSDNKDLETVKIVKEIASQYIQTTFYSNGYQLYEVSSLYDSDCTLLVAKESIFPPEYWIQGPPNKSVYADQSPTINNNFSQNVEFKLRYSIYHYDF